MTKAEQVIKDASKSLSYDPETGYLTRISSHYANQRFIGKRAGTLNERGYRGVRINRVIVLEHRVIWYMAHGTLPDEIDHINGIKDDNRLCNLRAATREQNFWNKPKPICNTSGFKGVSKAMSGKWQAIIKANKKSKYLGVFETPEEAHMAYIAASKLLHKEFANHG